MTEQKGLQSYTFNIASVDLKFSSIEGGEMTEQKGRELYIYHISQTEKEGYETYSDAVVVAHSPEDAVLIHPDGYLQMFLDDDGILLQDDKKLVMNFEQAWTLPYLVKCKKIGTADPLQFRGVVCASYHAG